MGKKRRGEKAGQSDREKGNSLVDHMTKIGNLFHTFLLIVPAFFTAINAWNNSEWGAAERRVRFSVVKDENTNEAFNIYTLKSQGNLEAGFFKIQSQILIIKGNRVILTLHIDGNFTKYSYPMKEQGGFELLELKENRYDSICQELEEELRNKGFNTGFGKDAFHIQESAYCALCYQVNNGPQKEEYYYWDKGELVRLNRTESDKKRWGIRVTDIELFGSRHEEVIKRISDEAARRLKK